MGRGDFPYIFRRVVTRSLESYRSTGLYYRNVAFCIFGALAGALWGIRELRGSSVKRPNEAAVRLAFYNVPFDTELFERRGSQDRHSRPGESGGLVPVADKKRRFEELWEETARKMQRLPGYAYTLMFRKLSCAESLAAFSLRDSHVAPSYLEDANDSSEGGQKPTLKNASDKGFAEYMEMRVWEGDEEPNDAKFLSQKGIDTMTDIGVTVCNGLYFRVFDDAIVRIIR